MTNPIRALVPMIKVRDVQRALDFYALLGFRELGRFEHDGKLGWADMQSERAFLMFSLDEEEPTPPPLRTVILYLYTPDVRALRADLLAKGVEVSEVDFPPYMPDGEICLSDPDGYQLLIGQPDWLTEKK